MVSVTKAFFLLERIEQLLGLDPLHTHRQAGAMNLLPIWLSHLSVEREQSLCLSLLSLYNFYSVECWIMKNCSVLHYKVLL